MTFRDHKFPKMMMIMKLLFVVYNFAGAGGFPIDNNEGMDDGDPKSDHDNNDEGSGDKIGRQHAYRGPREDSEPLGSQGTMELVIPVFMNLHAKCSPFQQRMINMLKVTP